MITTKGPMDSKTLRYLNSLIQEKERLTQMNIDFQTARVGAILESWSRYLFTQYMVYVKKRRVRLVQS